MTKRGALVRAGWDSQGGCTSALSPGFSNIYYATPSALVGPAIGLAKSVRQVAMIINYQGVNKGWFHLWKLNVLVDLPRG